MAPRLLKAAAGALLAFALAIALIVATDGVPSRHAELPEYLRPYRPWGIRAINAFGILLARVGLLDAVVSLDPDYFLSAACGKLMDSAHHPNKSRCVLSDDDGNWHPSFRRLTRALDDAKLTFLGRIIAHGQVMDMLETRGRLLRAFAEDPSMAASSSPLLDPIFVVGLPRTGTTFLQRLLAVDPANRSPTLWEYMNPVPRPPPPPPANGSRAAVDAYRAETRDRILDQQWKLDRYKSLAPGVDALHPLNATNPEECLIIMNYAMDSEQIADTYPVHEYMEWLMTLDDHGDALRWNRRVLQHLQRDDPYGPRRWVLKTPYYLAMLDDIRAVHPNAKVVHTHRDPEQSILSVSSVLAKLHGIVSDDISLQTIGAQQFSVREQMIRNAMKVRKEWADDAAADAADADADSTFRIVDVQLQDLQRDPLGAVNRIYEALFDAGLPPETAALMRDWLDNNPRTKHGTHTLPTMAEFGLEGRMMESDVFQSYREMFGAKGAASLSRHQEENEANKSESTAQSEL